MFDLNEFSLEPNTFKNPLMKWQLRGLWFLGHVVSRNNKFKVFHMLRGPLFAASLGFLITAQAAGVWINRHDINKAIAPLSGLIVFVNILTRVINFYPHHKRYVKLINAANAGVKKVFDANNDYEINLCEDYGKMINRITSALFFPILIAAIFMIGDASRFLMFSYEDLLQGSNLTLTLPRFYELYPFQLITNNFFIAYVLPFYMTVVGIIAFFTWHTFTSSLMRYASFQLDIINYKLTNINEYTDLQITHLNSFPSTSMESLHKLLIVSSVVDIVDVRSFIADLTKVTSAALFVESVTISGLLCLTLYQTTRDSIYGIGIYLSWGLTMVGILYNYYWHGNEISEKSDKITTSLYCSSWHEFPLSLQKDILILMKISRRPIIMKAVLFYMNNTSLLLILKSTYSYFTLLQNVAN